MIAIQILNVLLLAALVWADITNTNDIRDLQEEVRKLKIKR